MEGWKTKLGGVGAVLTGIGLIIAGVLADPMDGTKIIEGIAAISAGFVALGLGHKADKLKTEVKRANVKAGV